MHFSVSWMGVAHISSISCSPVPGASPPLETVFNASTCIGLQSWIYLIRKANVPCALDRQDSQGDIRKHPQCFPQSLLRPAVKLAYSLPLDKIAGSFHAIKQKMLLRKLQKKEPIFTIKASLQHHVLPCASPPDHQASSAPGSPIISSKWLEVVLGSAAIFIWRCLYRVLFLLLESHQWGHLISLPEMQRVHFATATSFNLSLAGWSGWRPSSLIGSCHPSMLSPWAGSKMVPLCVTLLCGSA